MFDATSDILTVPSATAPDMTGSTLADIRARARVLVGVPPNASSTEDDYADLWPAFVTQARDRLITRLPARCVLARTEEQIPVTGAGAYDLTRYAFLRIERVGYAVGSETTWVPVYEPHERLPWSGDYGDAGDPVAVTWDGRLLATFPWPSDTSAFLIVQGTRLPDEVLHDTDASGLPRMLNDVTALGAALAAIGYDIEREDHFTRRLPVLTRDYERAVNDVWATLMNARRARWGWRTQGVRLSDTATPASLPAPSVSVSGPLGGVTPRTVTVTPTEGESSVAIALEHAVAAGWTEPGWAIRCRSEQQGEIFDLVLSGDRMGVTATLPINPDTSLPMTFQAGDTVRFSYLSA